MRNRYSLNSIFLPKNWLVKFFAILFLLLSIHIFSKQEITSTENVDKSETSETENIYISGDALVFSSTDVLSNIDFQHIIIIEKNCDKTAKRKTSSKKKRIVFEDKYKKGKIADTIKKKVKSIPIKSHFTNQENKNSAFYSHHSNSISACFSNSTVYGFEAKSFFSVNPNLDKEWVCKNHNLHYNRTNYRFQFSDHYSVRPPPFV